MPVPAVLTNLAQFVGEDKVYQDTVYQADGITPQNISGWTVQFTIHAVGDSTAIYVQKSSSGQGIVFTNPTGGVLQISIARVDTINMNPGQYAYKIERTDAGFDGVPSYGLFTLLQA